MLFKLLCFVFAFGVCLSHQKKSYSQTTHGCTTTITCDSLPQGALDDFKELYFSFPKSCAKYIDRETANKRFERVPIYPRTVEDKTIMILANCSYVPPIVNPGFNQEEIFMAVPKNSVEGRTLILKGIPRNRDTFNRFSVNFDGPDPKIYFHFVSEMSGNSFVLNDFTTEWQGEGRILTSSDFQLKYDIEFTLTVKVDDVGYHVTLNGKFFTTFEHRQRPWTDIRQIRTKGPLEVTYLSFN
ncbi:uncharacterized protein LOC120326862 [Styela clava]